MISLHRCILLTVLIGSTSTLRAQINTGFAFGFEDGLSNIPGYSGSYNFVEGNNLQYGASVPDYYKSPDFGWQLQGWTPYSSTQAKWYNFDSTYVGNGANNISYPGNGATGAALNDAFNINKIFSPASGNLPFAPGLGNQFMDTWGKPNNGDVGDSAQMNLVFTATKTTSLLFTLAFGGRDANSQNTVGFYRIIEGNSILFSGSTNDSGSNPNPFQLWKPDAANSFTSSLADASTTKNNNNAGVTQREWEYYQVGNLTGTNGAFVAQANHIYQLQIMLPDELNFDLALGTGYSEFSNLVVPPVPEPSTYGLLGAGSLLGFAAFRRRKAARKAA